MPHGTGTRQAIEQHSPQSNMKLNGATGAGTVRHGMTDRLPRCRHARAVCAPRTQTFCTTQYPPLVRETDILSAVACCADCATWAHARARSTAFGEEVTLWSGVWMQSIWPAALLCGDVKRGWRRSLCDLEWLAAAHTKLWHYVCGL